MKREQKYIVCLYKQEQVNNQSNSLPAPLFLEFKSEVSD